MRQLDDLQIAGPAKLVAVPVPDELTRQRIAGCVIGAGQIVEHGVGQVLVTNRIFTKVTGMDCEGCSQTATRAFAADCDAISANAKPLCFPVKPAERGIAVVQRRGYGMLRGQPIAHRKYNNAKLVGDVSVH